MTLSADDVSWVAHLARLDLPAAEKDRLGDDLRSILEYIQQLQSLDTQGIEPLAHPLDLTNVLRPDEPFPSLPVDQALQNAPSRKGDFFSVPAVLE